MLVPIISEPRFYFFAVPAVIFLGLAKGGFSGAATAATPLLALYLPPLEAAALLLPLVLSAVHPDIDDESERCDANEDANGIIGNIRRK